jgi:glycerol-3-phosphate dehydrogenase
MIAQQPDLAQVVDGSDGVLAAEIVYACTHEGARHLDDVLDRRTRIAIHTPDRGKSATEHVLALMQEANGWSDDDVQHERDRYLQLVGRERQAAACDNDAPCLSNS